MKEYFIKKSLNDALTLKIDEICWSEFPLAPNTTVRITYDNVGINLWFLTDEKPLLMEKKEDNTNVFEDSCMEFFLRPNMNDKRYINFEINPLGTIHCAIGEDRFKREKIKIDKNEFKIKSEYNDKYWNLQYTVPFSFLKGYFKEITKSMYGNFYKCGEKTQNSHFAVWNPVETKNPDFHKSEYFGKLILD